MLTLQDWENALATPKQVYIVADQKLANDVNRLPASKSFVGQPKLAAPPSTSLPTQIDIAGNDLLLALGKTTTPRILNLVDLSSEWAYHRYIWAFDPARSYENLRLSQDAIEIDFHQKAVMSDDMGIGFATYIMENCFKVRSPMDVAAVLKDAEFGACESSMLHLRTICFGITRAATMSSNVRGVGKIAD